VFKARLRTGFLLGRCDESGDGFGMAGAEKPMAPLCHHPVLRRDETWLPEWSGKLGGTVCRSVARGVLEQD
jgi:hypothetical protein